MYIYIINKKTNKTEFTFLKTNASIKRAEEMIKKDNNLKMTIKGMTFLNTKNF